MGERQIRHIEDVFSGKIDRQNKPENMLDRKSSFNMFKNKQAPKPPGGHNGVAPLPKIGNYQPKILLPSPTNETRPLIEPTAQTVVAQVHNPPMDFKAKPIVIGDKNVPLQIESSHGDMRDDTPVAPLRRKRRAPEAPLRHEDDDVRHPFLRPLSQRSDEDVFDVDLEEQGGDIDFGEGIDNPVFHSSRDRIASDSSHDRIVIDHPSRERIVSDSSRERIVSDSSRHRSESSSSWQGEPKSNTTHDPRIHGITFPYIPPPDYEDEEVTMTFVDDDFVEPAIDYNTAKRNSAPTVYKELEGEDFGRYLQEEDYEFDAPRRGPRPVPPGRHFMKNGKTPPQNKPQKTTNMDKKSAKSKKKQKEKEIKRNTIRDFTFSDSKIGWGDRTVKSTTAKGRYVKHNKDRKRVDSAEMFSNDKSRPTGSYEEFLRIKNGLPLESPNSSDSGVDTSEDKRHMDMYMHSQPKQMRHGKADHKPSMWQRLTWKFRKSVNITRIESERL